MKTIVIISWILIMASVSLSGQAPQAFKYQAVIRDTTGVPFSQKEAGLRITILKGNMMGEEVYSEIHKVLADKLGLVNLNVGQGMEATADFSAIPWGEDLFFMKLEIDLEGNNNYHLLGTSQLLSVPYALYAGSSGSSLWNQAENDIFYNDGNVGIGTAEPAALLDIEHRPQTGGGLNQEVLFEGKIADAPDDFIKVYNGTGNDHQFIPTLWGHHSSDNRVAIGHIGTISPEADYGTEPVSIFASRIYKGEWEFADVQNRPLFSWRGAYDDKMIMLANGNLGIGTTNPQARLEINSSSDYDDGRDLLIVHNNSNDSLSLASIKIKSGDDNSSTAIQHNAGSYTWEGRSDLGILWNDGNGLILAATNDSGDIRFETGGAGLEKERMRITKDGKVGIGVTDPVNYKLFVSTHADGGGERAVALFQNRSTAVGSLCNVYIAAGDSGSTYLNYMAPSYIHWGGKYKMHTLVGNNGKGMVFRTGHRDVGRFAFEFKRDLGNTYTYDEKVSITYEGNMGIGVINPQRKLHINDVMRLEPSYSPPEEPSEGDIYMDGNDHVLMVYDGTEWKSCW